MKRLQWLLCVLVAMLCVVAQAAERDGTSKRVLVVSIDGCRPDLLLLADCPNARALMARGSYSLWAQTTPMGVTLPSHVSMMTGREIEDHGIYWNGSAVPEDVTYQYPRTSTLFELAKAAGYSTAIVSGKNKFKTLARPDTVDWLLLPEDTKEDDTITAANAVKVIREHAPQVMLLHLAEVDTSGHRDGWGSPEHLKSIENADVCLGQALAALQEEGLLEQTLIILSADHGGWAKKHNGSDARGLMIPWIIAGPGVKVNHDLTLEPELAVRTYDTFATACAYLGLEVPEDSDGRPVMEAFE
ncbi:MAG: alkaline phosphatase family protein [Phycisphaeraceae bacterium]|nr:alkaline phosphatase family protein [Phycisphaeraceae bacterium]